MLRPIGSDALESVYSLILSRNQWNAAEVGRFASWEEALESVPPQPRLKCPVCSNVFTVYTARPDVGRAAGQVFIDRGDITLKHAVLKRANMYWRFEPNEGHVACVPKLRAMGWIPADAAAELAKLAGSSQEKATTQQINEILRIGLTVQDFERRRFASFDVNRCHSTAADAKKLMEAHAPGEKGFALIGPTGTGKTHLLTALAMKLSRSGGRVTWLRFVDVVSRLRQGAARGAGEEGERVEAVINAMSNAELLFLDDLGAEHGSPFVTAALLDVLDTRVRYGKPLYMTANKGLDELAKSYDERVASRIAALCEVIEIKGKDARRG